MNYEQTDRLIDQWHDWVYAPRGFLVDQLQGNAQLLEAAEDWHRILQLPEVPTSQRDDARFNRDCIMAELGFKARL